MVCTRVGKVRPVSHHAHSYCSFSIQLVVQAGDFVLAASRVALPNRSELSTGYPRANHRLCQHHTTDSPLVTGCSLPLTLCGNHNSDNTNSNTMAH